MREPVCCDPVGIYMIFMLYRALKRMPLNEIYLYTWEIKKKKYIYICLFVCLFSSGVESRYLVYVGFR